MFEAGDFGGVRDFGKTTEFEATYGGSEANVALSLANLGIDASFFTVVPNNSLGKSAVRMLKSNDVNCDKVIYSTEEETPTKRNTQKYCLHQVT